MNTKQKHVMDSLVRVRAFLDAYPATGRLTYVSAREMLDDVIRRPADRGAVPAIVEAPAAPRSSRLRVLVRVEEPALLPE